MTTFVSRFDFRAPGADRAQRQELYSRGLEQAAYLDQHGHDALMVSEHHVSDDGYLPSPLLVAAAMAARTSRVPITVSALLVNMYEPVKLAEDVAVLDLLSAGRVSYTLGLGYRPEEYALFGGSWESRGADIESRIVLLLALWRGEEVEHDGRTVRLTPLPFSDPHPFLFYGGGSPAAARRAARLGLNFQPNVADKALRELYNEECRRHGRDPGFVLLPPTGPATVFCAEDPDRFWGEHGRHLLADAMAYRAWSGTKNTLITDDSSTVEELRAGGRFVVLDPDEMVRQCRERELKAVSCHPLCGGLPEEPSWESLRLISERVLPTLRAPDPAAEVTA
ncbi:MAG: LLM class flavin-dependent oxidoreductase [Marmoricola sp.]